MQRHRFATYLVAFTAIGVLAGCTLQRFDEARKLVRESRPFSIDPREPTARLLVVGDSTAVGTGATSPEGSLAGQLSKRIPTLAIDNRGGNGARCADVSQQIASARGRYDAVLIQCGGNDVIRLTGANQLREDVDAAIAAAKAIAPVVVVMPAGNVGNAPFFPPPVSWLMTSRARVMHDAVREAAQAGGAYYVNLYKPKESDPFAQQPEIYHAADGLHPSDAGYAQWLSELLSQSPLEQALRKSS